MKDETIFIRIDPEIKERVKEICKSERRSLSSLILILIDEKIRREDARKDRNSL